jgi:hypothetical protein
MQNLDKLKYGIVLGPSGRDRDTRVHENADQHHGPK